MPLQQRSVPVTIVLRSRRARAPGQWQDWETRCSGPFGVARAVDPGKNAKAATPPPQGTDGHLTRRSSSRRGTRTPVAERPTDPGGSEKDDQQDDDEDQGSDTDIHLVPPRSSSVRRGTRRSPLPRPNAKEVKPPGDAACHCPCCSTGRKLRPSRCITAFFIGHLLPLALVPSRRRPATSIPMNPSPRHGSVTEDPDPACRRSAVHPQ